MGVLLDDATVVAEAARALLASAGRVHEAVARAQAALEGTACECHAARRHCDRMGLLAGRVHHHGNALTEAGVVLIRRAASLAEQAGIGDSPG